MHDFLRNANHWRDRAEETRAKAERFAIAKTEKERLLRIAAEYERLAERAEKWQTAEEPSVPRPL